MVMSTWENGNANTSSHCLIGFLPLHKVHRNHAFVFGVNFAAEGAIESVFDFLVSGFGDIHPPVFAVLLQARCGVYRITPDVICKFLDAYNPGYNRPGMDADPY